MAELLNLMAKGFDHMAEVLNLMAEVLNLMGYTEVRSRLAEVAMEAAYFQILARIYTIWRPFLHLTPPSF